MQFEPHNKHSFVTTKEELSDEKKIKEVEGILKLIKKELDEIELVTLKRKEGYFPLSLENFDIQAAEQRDKEQRKQFLEKQKRHALQALYNLNKRKTKQVDRASSSKQSFPTKNEFSIF